MGPTRLLVIQPSQADPAGNLGDWLTDAGADLDIALGGDRAMPESLDGYQGVVCLGGEMGAYDDAEHPWLSDVRRLLASAVTAKVPVLGVCLGGQLLAAACGGRVVRADDGPEVGPALVAKRDVAWTDPLFAELPMVQDVMQFHLDVIDRLPAGAAVLASSTRYPNQAFRVGSSAYGLQFHIETTTDMVLGWARLAPDAAAAARPGDLTRERLDAAHSDIAETWAPFAGRFVRLAAGDLAPADQGRTTLPLV